MTLTKNKAGVAYFVYVRKSSESGERQVQSIDDQKLIAKGLADTHKFKIRETFEDSYSALNPYKRPAFTAMIKAIKKNGPSGIICWKLDRLARNPEEAGIIMGMLQRGEISHIRTYEKDYYPADNSLLTFVEFGIANQSSRDLGVNVKRGLKSKLSKGWRPGSTPHGYLNTKTKNRGENTIIKDPQRYADIKAAWGKLLEGNLTPIQILNWLNNERGFRTRVTTLTGGKPLSRASIYKIFTNIFYTGQFEYGGVLYPDGKHPKMVTLEEFDRAQIILGKRGKPRVQTTSYSYTGAIKCGTCKRGLIGTFHRKLNETEGKVVEYVLYFCEHCRKNKVKPVRYVNVQKIESAIEQELERTTLRPEFLEWALDIIEDQESETHMDKKHVQGSLQKAVDACEKRMSRLLDGYSKEVIDDEDYLTQKNAIKAEQSRLRERIEGIEETAGEWLPLTRETFRFATYAHQAFVNGDAKTRREILLGLADLNSTLEGTEPSIKALDWFVPVQGFNVPFMPEISSLELIAWLTSERKDANGHLSLSMRGRRDLNSQPPACT